jgi:hypothetical protein
MERVRAFLFRRPIFLVIGALALVVVLGGAAGAYYFTQTPPEQPIDFPHNVHVAIGAECIYCHSSATSSPVAGLPTTEKCWACHQQISRTTPELEKLAEYARAGEQIPWVPVAIQPDFVHFTHEQHIQAGLACETCHGDLSQMRVAEVQAGQNMGWCLDCHVSMRPENAAYMTDCSLCHY